MRYITDRAGVGGTFPSISLSTILALHKNSPPQYIHTALILHSNLSHT